MKSTPGVQRMLALWTVALLASLPGTPPQAAPRIDLDQGWQFRADPDEFGASFNWQEALPAGTENINVPHTWNVGRLHDFMGVAW